MAPHEKSGWSRFPKIATGNHIVLVGSFNYPNPAHSLIKRLGKLGIPAFVETGSGANKNKGYHVKVGPFDNRENGQSAAKIIRERTRLKPVYTRSRIKRCLTLNPERTWATIRSKNCP